MIQSRLQSKSFRLPWPTDDVQYTVTLKNPVFNTEILNPITEVVSYRPNNHRPTHSTRIIIPSPKKEKKGRVEFETTEQYQRREGVPKKTSMSPLLRSFLPRGSFGTGSTSSVRCVLCSWKQKEGLLGAGLLLLLDTFRGGVFFCCSTVAKGFFQTSSCFTVFCFSKDGSELLFRTFHLIRWRSRSSSSSSSVLASDILEWESSSRGEFGISSFFRMCCFGLLHWVSQAPLRIFHRLRRRRRHRIPSAQIPSNSYYNRDK